MKLRHFSADPFVLDRTIAYPQEVDAPFAKPRGLWVSDESEGAWGWASWCRRNEFQPDALRHAYAVDFGASIILIIRTLDEFDAFEREHVRPWRSGAFSLRDSRVRWEVVAGRWDGIIISPYQGGRRFDSRWYYGWDCASGCIWNLEHVTLTPLPALTEGATDAG